MEVNKKRYATIIVLYNPEVVGSSPASATIKTTVFQANTVVFLFQKFVTFGNPIRFDPVGKSFLCSRFVLPVPDRLTLQTFPFQLHFSAKVL